MKTYTSNDLLFEDIKEGDGYAFKILFIRYYGKLSKICYSIIRRWEIAEELAVDILHTLFIKANEIVVTEGLDQYLYRSAHNAALNYLRDESRRKVNITSVPEFSSEPIEEDSLLKHILGEKEETRYELFESMLSLLPAESQQVMRLKKQGMTYKAIARDLNLPEKKVRNLIDRAIRKLRMHYQKLQVGSLCAIIMFRLFHDSTVTLIHFLSESCPCCSC